jgi:hypothetical protein
MTKTIDGDIQVQDAKGQNLCAVSFGFHTAALAFSRNIANLCTDAASDVKYWHICKVMGRVASHLALEVALQTHPTLTLIGEELADFVDMERIRAAEKKGERDYTAYGMTLRHLSSLRGFWNSSTRFRCSSSKFPPSLRNTTTRMILVFMKIFRILLPKWNFCDLR